MTAKESIQAIAKSVQDQLPEGYGFFVLAFPFGDSQEAVYCSNARRDDIVKSMQEFIDRQIFPKLENN